MKSERRLMVEFGDDSRVDEYRIRGGHLEFHARRPGGTDIPKWVGKWRELAAADISLHLFQHTPVAEWFAARLSERARAQVMSGETSCARNRRPPGRLSFSA